MSTWPGVPIPACLSLITPDGGLLLFENSWNPTSQQGTPGFRPGKEPLRPSPLARGTICKGSPGQALGTILFLGGAVEESKAHHLGAQPQGHGFHCAAHGRGAAIWVLHLRGVGRVAGGTLPHS